MRTSTAVLAVAVVIFFAGAAWYVASRESGAKSAETQQSVPAPTAYTYQPGNVLLGTDGNTTLGTYVIGFNGQSVYTYDEDGLGVSNCTNICAENWPPYTIIDLSGLQNLKAGVSGDAGFIRRADGSYQVTYNGKPLYFYKNDASGHDASGDGAGGVWHVVKP